MFTMLASVWMSMNAQLDSIDVARGAGILSDLTSALVLKDTNWMATSARVAPSSLVSPPTSVTTPVLISELGDSSVVVSLGTSY